MNQTENKEVENQVNVEGEEKLQPVSIEKSSSEKKEEPKPTKAVHSSRKKYEDFLEALEKISSIDEKVQKTIEFMEGALCDGEHPNFKDFWESRSKCLELFKGAVSPAVRTTSWAKYQELSDQARRLKDILNEQSAFAAEQIDIAIKALQDEQGRKEELLQTQPELTLPSNCKTIEKNYNAYNTLQKELDLLGNQALKINSLRKELINTEMRVRQKNQFFQSLSKAGDLVFPRRKELIKEVSTLFIVDVDSFTKTVPATNDPKDPVYLYRDEIKSLQSAAKVLTLNTHAFSATRLKLSQAWDKIKDLDKERKKERRELQEKFQENADQITKKIDVFKASFAEGGIDVEEAKKELQNISTEMRNVELSRREVNALKEQLAEARAPLDEILKKEEAEREKMRAEKEKERLEQIESLKGKIELFVDTECKELEITAIEEKRDALLEEIQSLQASRAVKSDLEKLMKVLKDVIQEKEEAKLLSLSDNDRETLENLKEVLKQRKERRKEVKATIEKLRKESGSSGFDFAQAMEHEALVEDEKERLQKSSDGILEIEEKIRELKAKL